MTFRDLPIRRKLASVILAKNILTLLIVCTTFTVYEAVSVRQTMQRDLATLGKVIATNSTAALAFDNADDAREVLAALKAEPHIAAAAIYDRNGHLFVSYPAGLPITDLPSAPGADGYHFEPDRLVGVQAVVQGSDNHRLGTLYVESNLNGYYERLQRFAEIALVVISASVLLALAVSWFLQLQISKPVLQLAGVARKISGDRDYSVRATRSGNDEIGQLADAFNQMLTQIQQQHGELSDGQTRMRAQLERMNLLHHITRAIGERQDLPSIFQVLIRSLEDNLDIDFGCICLYDAGVKTLTVISVGARGAEAATQTGLISESTIPIDENGLSRCVRGQLVYEPDIADVAFPFPQRLAGIGLRAMVLAPLSVESKVFGVLIAARRTANSFSSPDCEFLKQLSEHIALATHQAQLYGALQQAYDDLRQTQQAVLQQERLRALGQMASGIAHDINNAISPVTLYTETLLEKEQGLSATARRYLETIQRAIEDVAQTVLRMREFYRHRDTDMTLAPVQLNKIVPQVLDLTRVRWSDMPQQRGVVIEVRSEFTQPLPLFMGVESEIREALTNLIFNAIDAMPDGGTLTIRTGVMPKTSDRVFLEVVDSGIGMDEKTRRRCLEPFYTTKGERGTGLGLAMVYGMVQRHSAGIEIDSEPGQGTCMRLVFLATNAFESSGNVTSTIPQSQQPLRILIIDDDPLVINSLRDTLESDGHTVTTADGGQKGIDEFLSAHRRRQSFSIVITDLGMPYVDGRKVSESIKMASPATPIVMLTGWGQRLVAENDIPAHVDRVLNKPPKLAELRKALTELCMRTELSA